MKSLAVFVIVLAASSSASALYRCDEKGKVVISDRPCTGESTQSAPASGSKGTVDAGNPSYVTSNGAWRGQVQFMAKSGTAVVNEAHAVTPFVIEIDPQGKVTGTGNGCTVKGIAAPSPMDTITTLDVTLKGCSYPAFNRQMTGRLALYRAQKYVDFSLQSYDMQRRPSGYFEIKGTLRR